VANRTNTRLLGEYKVRFKVAGEEQTVHAVITKAVHEFILGTDFLSDEDCQWDFGAARAQLSED